MAPSPSPRPRSLRRRIRSAIVGVAVLALLLLGLPLAVVVGRLIDSQALAGLQRDATLGVAAVPDNTLEAGSAADLPDLASGTRLGVYDRAGRRVGGQGPALSPLAARAADGREHNGQDSGDLTAVLPVLSDTAVAGSVRAAVPLSSVRSRVLRAWGLLAALAAAVVGCSLLLAARAARRLAVPFEQLTRAARDLGIGRYDVDVPPFGIPEADAAADALQDSARRIDALVQQERAFVGDVSHQLRTPLSGVVLALSRIPPDVPSALLGIGHLETTMADVLALRRSTEDTCSAGAVAAHTARRWSTTERPVLTRGGDVDPVALSAPALRQALDVLVDNGLRHGAGPVTVTVEPYGDVVVVEVADQGDGFPPGAEPGTGLLLATRIVERAGGSLLVRRRAPQARVALLLPRAQPGASTSKR